MRVVFGKPRVLDISQALDRNGVPFLVAHVGVRSTFLKNSYEPWLRDALIVCAAGGAGGDAGGRRAGECCAASAGGDQCAAGEPDAGWEGSQKR